MCAKQINKKSSLEAPKGNNKEHIQQSLEQQNIKNIPNSLAGALNKNNNRKSSHNTPKNIIEYAEATDNFNKLQESECRELEKELLEADPYIFLINIEKYPGDLLNDEEILKMLDERLLGSGFTRLNGTEHRYLDKLIAVDPKVYNKYADRLIEQGRYFPIFEYSEYFKGEIDFLEKIKKIIEREKNKENTYLSIFDQIIELGGGYLVDAKELAALFEKEGQDIKKYPRIFGKVLYDRDPENIKLLLNTFEGYSKYEDGYMVYHRIYNGEVTVYGFVKDGEIIFDGYELRGFHKAFEKRKKNLPLTTTVGILKKEGHITTLSSHNQGHNSLARIKIPNGGIGTAISIDTQNKKRDKDVEILNENGEFLTFIKGPEGTSNTVLSSDENSLYICSYGDKISYLTAYNTEDFSKKWEIPLNSKKIISIDISGNELITYDENSKKVAHFNKINGEKIKGKDTDVEKDSDYAIISKENLATFNLIKAIPQLEEGIRHGVNEVKNHFDEDLFDSFLNIIGQKVTVDVNNKRVYLTLKDKEHIGIFDKNGLIGLIPYLYGIQNLNFDQKTGSLLVSGYRKIDVFDSEAINRIIEKTNDSLK